MKLLSLLAGLLAAEAFSTYAIFIGHTLKPISFYLTGKDHSGVGGKYQEIFHFDGLIGTLVGTLMVFGLVWLASRGTIWAFTTTKPAMPRALVQRLRMPAFSVPGYQRSYAPPLSGLPRPAIA